MTSSPFPFIDQKEDQQLLFFAPPHQASSSSPSLSSPNFFNITQDQRPCHPRQPQKNQHKADKYIVHGGSSDHQVIIASSSVQPTVDSANYKDSHELSIYKLEDEAEQNRRDCESAKWMPSKIGLIRKMTNTGFDGSDHQKQERRIVQEFRDKEQDDGGTNSPVNGNNIVRVCSDCKTTKTPLWRSGPQGPKSLCNACGIRQRKARRAMLEEAAAAEAGNGTVVDHADNSSSTKVQKKVKKSHMSYMEQYKKPFKLHGTGEKISFEDFALSLSKNSAFRRAFPKDEEEAAILLMALSCDLSS